MLILLFLPFALAFWRMDCGNIQTGRIDPIISPGQIASHVHKISGPSNIGLSSTYSDLLSAPCTSCEIQDDKSAYWTPKLYYAHPSGFEEVVDNGMTVYYMGRGWNRTNQVPFPPGFRMVSGNNSARTYATARTWSGDGLDFTGTCQNYSCTSGQFVPGNTIPSRPIADAVSFKCVGGNETETPNLQYLDCPNGLRAQLQFQTCWDGVNLYKSDQSHVAHMSEIDNGFCPPSHPIQFVHLFFEITYQVNNIANQDGHFIFSNGDTTGYGFHGDFLNGWNMTTQTAAVKNCANTDDGGLIQACPALMLSRTSESSFNCPEQPPLINEQVHGTLTALPGCNAGVPCAPTPPPSVNPTSSLSAQATFIPKSEQTYNNWIYLGNTVDSAGSRLLQGDSTVAKDMTIELCQTYCSDRGYPLAGVEYSQECYCGSNMAAANFTDSWEFSMICGGNSSQFCGGMGLISIWNSTLPPARKQIPSAVGDKLGNLQYMGCAVDSVSNRTLQAANYADSSITIESCGSFCKASGASFAGLEYTRECWCGNTVSSFDSTNCNMLCGGNDIEWCGGPNALSVWQIIGSSGS